MLLVAGLKAEPLTVGDDARERKTQCRIERPSPPVRGKPAQVLITEVRSDFSARNIHAPPNKVALVQATTNPETDR